MLLLSKEGKRKRKRKVLLLGGEREMYGHTGRTVEVEEAGADSICASVWREGKPGGERVVWGRRRRPSPERYCRRYVLLG